MEVSWLVNTLRILKNFYEINPFPYLALAAWLLFGTWYVRKAFKDYEKINRYVLQMIPFVFTALGLLGAVTGSLGFIWGFTPQDLLSGSKTLFKGVLGSCTTAIVGIALSLTFSKLVSMTHYKVELRKALENNELFVLKKMLKLLLKAYAADQKNAHLSLEAVKGLRRDLHNMDNTMQNRDEQLKKNLQDALLGEDNTVSLSEQLSKMHHAVRQHTQHTLKQERHHNQLILDMAQALTGSAENSIASQLTSLRAEQRNHNAVLETNLGALYERLQRIDVKSLGQSLRTAISDQTKTLEASLSSHAGTRNALFERQNQGTENLLQAVFAGAQANENAMQELGRLHTHALQELLEAHERQAEAQREANGNQAAQLAILLERSRGQEHKLIALAQCLDPANLAALPQSIQDVQARLRDIIKRLDTNGTTLTEAFTAQQELITAMKSALVREITMQQAQAAAQAAAIASQEFAGLVRPTLEKSLTQLRERMEASARERAAATGQTFEALHKQQTARLHDIAGQLHDLTTRMQQSFDRINDLTSRTEDVANNTDVLNELMEHTQQAMTWGQTLNKALEKLATIQPENSGQSLASTLGDSMRQLVGRLRQIDSIKKTDNKFWRQVERQMHDGIPIIMGGNKLFLNDDLNGNFQERLQRSFNNLDKILQTIVHGYQQKADQGIMQ